MKSSFFLLVAVSLMFMSAGCKKEKEKEIVIPEKMAPKADAGSDLKLEIPKNCTTLSGKASDADGNIESLEWKKITGPQTVVGEMMTSYKPKVIWMEEGEYEFELTVTDNDGLIDKDTVKVTVSSSLHKLVIKGSDFKTQSNNMPGISVPAEVYNNLKWFFVTMKPVLSRQTTDHTPGLIIG